jgi:hypothetical protein
MCRYASGCDTPPWELRAQATRIWLACHDAVDWQAYAQMIVAVQSSAQGKGLLGLIGGGGRFSAGGLVTGQSAGRVIGLVALVAGIDLVADAD